MKKQPGAFRKTDRRMEVEKELRELRNTNRLAIHMNESKREPYMYHRSTWSFFNTPREEVLQLIAESRDMNQQLPLTSMSLLPAGERSIRPFRAELSHRHYNDYGYLVDLSQEKEFPARVVGAAERTMNSLESRTQKIFWDKAYAFLPDRWKRLYTSDAAWMNACSDPQKSSEITEGLLDKLASHYAGENLSVIPPIEIAPLQIYALNELIVSAQREHVRAIAVPVYDQCFEEGESAYPYMTKLIAALTGLDHLRQKPPIDLPVVLYHMDGAEKAKKGDITYVGQGREELMGIALDMLETLHRTGTWKQYHEDQDVSRKAVDTLLSDLLGISGKLNATEWAGRIAQLRAQLSAEGGIAEGAVR